VPSTFPGERMRVTRTPELLLVELTMHASATSFHRGRGRSSVVITAKTGDVDLPVLYAGPQGAS